MHHHPPQKHPKPTLSVSQCCQECTSRSSAFLLLLKPRHICSFVYSSFMYLKVFHQLLTRELYLCWSPSQNVFSPPTLVSWGIWLVPACTVIFLWKPRLARSVTVSLALSWALRLRERREMALFCFMLQLASDLPFSRTGTFNVVSNWGSQITCQAICPYYVAL